MTMHKRSTARRRSYWCARHLRALATPFVLIWAGTSLASCGDEPPVFLAPSDVADATDSGDDADDIGEDAEDVSSDAELDPEPDTGVDAEPDADLDVAPDAVVDVAPDAEPDADPDAPVDAEPDVLPDADPDLPADVEPDAEPDILPDAPVGGCIGHLDACDSETETTDDFFCDTEAGQCIARCDFDTADDTRSADCPLNSYCLVELTVDDLPGLNGVCSPGDCESNIFDPEACDGTGTCLPVGNGASFCIPAGTASEGGACNTVEESPPASDICSPGLLCFEGSCITPCDLGDDCGGLECVSAFDVTPRNRPGVCGTECPEFSGGSCAEGESCRIVSGRFGINAWMCLEVGDSTIVEAGEDCSSEGVECADGTICVGTDDVGGAECASICDPLGESAGDYATCVAEGVVCTPSALSGFGFCQEACTPYPRGPGSYGCDEDSDTCLPFVSRDDRPVEPLGFCTDDDGFAAAYEDCSNDGFHGGDCADFAVCLALEEGGTSECLPLCEPFGDDQCGSGNTCSGIPPLVGQLNLSFCITDPQPGDIGDPCTEEGLPCAADHSICLDMGSGPTCLGVCRAGFGDCDSFGLTCNTADLNPDVVPSYMGLCR